MCPLFLIQVLVCAVIIIWCITLFYITVSITLIWYIVLRRNTIISCNKTVTQYTVLIMYMKKSCHMQSRSYHRVSLFRPTRYKDHFQSIPWVVLKAELYCTCLCGLTVYITHSLYRGYQERWSSSHGWWTNHISINTTLHLEIKRGAQVAKQY